MWIQAGASFSSPTPPIAYDLYSGRIMILLNRIFLVWFPSKNKSIFPMEGEKWVMGRKSLWGKVFAPVKCVTEISKSNIQSSFLQLETFSLREKQHSLDQCFSNFSVHQNHLDDLLRQNVGSYHPQIYWLWRPAVSASICVSNKFLYAAAGPGSTELG